MFNELSKLTKLIKFVECMEGGRQILFDEFFTGCRQVICDELLDQEPVDTLKQDAVLLLTEDFILDQILLNETFIVYYRRDNGESFPEVCDAIGISDIIKVSDMLGERLYVIKTSNDTKYTNLFSVNCEDDLEELFLYGFRQDPNIVQYKLISNEDYVKEYEYKEKDGTMKKETFNVLGYFESIK